MESFFASLKKEFFYRREYATIEDVERSVLLHKNHESNPKMIVIIFFFRRIIMDVFHLPYIGFDCRYNMSRVESAQIRYKDNSITFHKEDEMWTIFLGKIVKLGPYQEQYGITVSNSCFFVQSWEKGLFCFQIKTGELLWHIKIRHAGELYCLQPDFVFCFFENYGVLKIDITTGNTVRFYKASSDTCRFWEIGRNRYLLGLVRKKYFILDEELKNICEIPEVLVNPNHYDVCIVHNAVLSENMLTMEITEYSLEAGQPLKFTQENFGKRLRTINLKECHTLK
jgi:hypothetical protein